MVRLYVSKKPKLGTKEQTDVVCPFRSVPFRSVSVPYLCRIRVVIQTNGGAWILFPNASRCEHHLP